MKQLKDYLHLYLDAQIRMLDKATGEWSKPITLNSNVLNNILMYDGGVNFSYQLLLRPLSDMTGKEAIEFCKAYSPDAFGDYRFSKWVATREEDNCCYNVTNEKSDMSFNVDIEKMHVKVYEGGEDTYPGIENHTYFLEYLKNGFDIFDLIPYGLAIDKTKL